MKSCLGLILFLITINCFAINPEPEITSTIPSKNTVALTFDDGPHPVFTPQILAILKKNHVQATFFVVGANAKKYPELIKQIHDEGHVIGNHTYSHPILTNINEAELRKEIKSTSDIVLNITGVTPKCLRYPFGVSNVHIREQIRKQSMLPTPMGFNSFDYERPGTKKIVNWILKNLHSRQVILLHDGYSNREQTVDALAKIIEGIKQKGLGFSTICA